MQLEHKKRTEKRGITVTLPWHNGRMGVAYHSQRRGITVAQPWHNGHGAWHSSRTTCGITVAMSQLSTLI